MKKVRGWLAAVLAIIMILTMAVPTFAENVGVGTVNITSNKQQWQSLVTEITDEGMTLLKNSNQTLPLKNKKVNLLGFCGWYPVYSGSGSGNVASDSNVDFRKSLESAGFQVNTAPIDEQVYPKENPDSGAVAKVSAMLPSFKQREPAVSSFKGNASFDNMKKFSDTAIVVLGRNGGEGSDLTDKDKTDITSTGYTSKDGRKYLQISRNEEDLLKKARATFKNVILVLNSDNMISLAPLKSCMPDAVIWTGLPGSKGLTSFGKILNGTVNPSGRLPDTWVYDNTSSAAYRNLTAKKASNTKLGNVIDYSEGIYVGYRWYETAYAEKAKVNGFNYGDYNSVVAFPFGTGLSYTTFSQELKGGIPKTLKPHSTFNVKVKVKNTGDVPGKETVQLYLTAPYTNYDKQHAVEKSAVELVGFAKTKLLQPGKSQTVSIPVSTEKLAAYDSSYQNAGGKKGAYMLDAGKYIFSIRSNSHNVIESQDADVKDTFFYSGADKRSTDKQQAYNEFTDAERGTYLSRQNGFANFEKAMTSTSTEAKDLTYQDDPYDYNKEADKKVTKHYVEGVDYARKGNLKYTDMRGRDYNDPVCDEVVKQLTKDELVLLTRWGTFRTSKADSVGHPETIVTDGPLGINSALDSSLNGTSYSSIPLLAATFNKELAQRYGSYIADEAHSLGITGWYGPGMDIHRTPYSGRNFEYYSEDPVLSADMATEEVKAATDKGLICFMKHFVLNDTETARAYHLHTYASEQAIRQIYLRPFEDGVKEGKAKGIMAACNFVGDVWTAANPHLMTEVLRNEWGFMGMSCTDMSGDPIQYKQWTAGDAILRGGTDMWLGLMPDVKKISSSSDADIYYLQRAAKHILYTEANAVVIPASKTHNHGWLQ